MRVCPTCGREVPEAGARFCGFCGGPMPDAPTEPVATGGVQHRRPDEVAAPVARPVSQPTDTIGTRLDPATIATDPGGTATVTLRVRNTGTVVDELRIVVEGPVAPWAEVEPAVLRLMPGTDGAASIRFRPPRIPLALAGPMGFVVRVHSHERPQEPAMESGVLTVGEVRALGAVVVPATGKSRGGLDYEVRVENRGNVPTDVAVSASDPDEVLQLDLDRGVQRIPPGESRRIALRVTPRAGILLGNPERRPFGVDVTSEGRVAAQAQAALVQVPRLPPWAPMAAAGALALAVLAVASVAFGVLPPKPAPTSPPAAQSPGASGGVAVVGSPSPSVVASDAPSESTPASPSEAPSDTPSDAPSATPTEPPSESPTLPPDACVSGYVWRQLIDGDHVCVTDATFAQIQADNAAAPTRWMDGAFGPHTCIAGYVWRDAFSGDDVCVTGDVRATTALDNQAGPLRVAPRTDACVPGFVYREAALEDHVCVDPAVRLQVVADNLLAPTRWTPGAYGDHTCVSGYVWRDAFSGDDVCVTGDVRNQALSDTQAAPSRIAQP